MASGTQYLTQQRLALEAECPGFPSERAAKYVTAGVWREDTFSCALTEICSTFRDRLALVDQTRHLTFGQLNGNVASMAAGFRGLGLISGDVAVVQMRNTISFVETVLALIHLGVVPVLTLPAHRKAEIGQFLRFTQATTYIIPETDSGFDFRQLADALRNACPQLKNVIVDGAPLRGQLELKALYQAPCAPVNASPEGVALFQISGGTTGTPKLIPRRHQEYLCNMRLAAQASGMDAKTVYLCVLPAAHNFAFACPGIFGALLSGGCTVLSESVDPSHNFDLIERHGVTITSVVPPILQAWMAKVGPHQLDTLHHIQVGGARLAEEVARQVRSILGCGLQQVYGMAEGLVCYTALDADETAICSGSTYPMSDLDDVRITETGLLQVRGPYTMNGYFKSTDINAEAFSADGYYTPGALVARDGDGAIRVVGRQKEQINRGGEKLAGEDLENVLIAHPSVVDAAVVGMPDDVMGELIHAFIIPADSGLRPLTLKRFLRDQGLATFKMPDKITLVDRFPKTGVGKVNKAALRKALRHTHQLTAAEE